MVLTLLATQRAG